jgi:hypothetical protein
LKACSKKELIMRLLTLTTALMIATMATTVALADVHVTFRDGAPKDILIIANLGACSTGPMTLTIDLATAPAGLIFDITNEGEVLPYFNRLNLRQGPNLSSASAQ